MSKYFEMSITVTEDQIPAIYALLGGVSSGAVAAAGNVASASPAPKVTEAASVQATFGAVQPSTEPVVDDGAPDVDAHGWPWSAELHASTKGTTKDGLWRMKVGVTRPDPKPGFPVADAAESAAVEESQSAGDAGTENASGAEASSASEEDDEFAAFRAAAAKSDAEDAAAKTSVPARKWTAADLGALCNQAAVKLSDPIPVKEIITQFIPEGTVAHSRNIPEDQREAFAKALEAKAGIEFAG